MSVCVLQTGAFCCPQKNLKKVCCLSWQNFGASVEGSRKGNINPPPGTVDKYFSNENEETFCAGGLKITAKLLADAMHSLPDEKRRTVLLYYFFEMIDAEIAELMKIPRSTVQHSTDRQAKIVSSVHTLSDFA